MGLMTFEWMRLLLSGLERLRGQKKEGTISDSRSIVIERSAEHSLLISYRFSSKRSQIKWRHFWNFNPHMRCSHTCYVKDIATHMCLILIFQEKEILSRTYQKWRLRGCSRGRNILFWPPWTSGTPELRKAVSLIT